MTSLVLRRVLYLLPVLFIVSAATFFMLELVPGDPTGQILGPEASPEQIANLRLELGLDQPVLQRYVEWLSSVVRGDFGRSLVPPVQDVSEMIGLRLPVTLEIAALAMVMSLAISIPFALIAAYRVNGRFDRGINSMALGLVSVPSFLSALLLVFFFVFNPGIAHWGVALLGLAATVFLVVRAFRSALPFPRGLGRERRLALWLGPALVVLAVTVVLFRFWPDFPRQGFSRLGSGEGIGENLRKVFLPALTLTLAESAVFIRLLRNDLVATLQEDYVLFARAKGMPGHRVVMTDALRPSSFSMITVAGIAFGRLIGGTLIVETVFNLPGMGTMIVRAVGSGDFRVVQAGVLVIAVFYVLINSLIDISYAYLDPRVRRG